MKLTRELKQRIDDYFDNVVVKDLAKIFEYTEVRQEVELDIDLICNDLEANMFSKPSEQGEKMWNQRRQEQINLLQSLKNKQQ